MTLHSITNQGRSAAGARATAISPVAFVLLFGLFEVATLAAFGWLDGIELPLPRLLLPAAAFLCYVAAGLGATRGPAAPLVLLWGVGILARLVLLPLAPELSDDIYRYLWDGHVLREGVNPYAHPPGHEALAAIRTEWHGEINHPHVSTIYPPLAQVLFGLVNLAGGTILAAKLVWLCFDLGCAVLLQGIAARTGRNPARVLVWYLWSPLLIVETAWSAHFDAVGLFFLTAVIRVAAWKRPTALGAVLGLAALVKFAPTAALPPLARRYGLRTLVAFIAVCAILYLPFAGAGVSALTAGLRTYARHWSANEGAFSLVLHLAGDPVRARVAVSVLVLAVAGYATWRRFSVERALLWILGAGLLLSPTVHPWYVLWVLPMAALRGHAPFLLAGGLAFLGYWGLAGYEATGVWPQPGWNRAAMWLPVWGLLLWRLAPSRTTTPDPEREEPGREEGHEGE
ncbi:MAG: DUF2029 domain-containing protein [Gemmatimonadetes bacterium]|nr:DUF2029 domain-containing protein [Gemmatimonadota bacterium]MYH52245.1 DUF2029 domain-containing protein [Gemmatimonadota bacterium]MYK67663.1 DUF2029 domain-containing protein [Gemmatimonadota bacterium]